MPVFIASNSPLDSDPAQDMDTHIPRADERTLQTQVQELMCFIWDNYLQLCDNIEDIFLVGVGSAYLGIKVLLINRGGSVNLAGEMPC